MSVRLARGKGRRRPSRCREETKGRFHKRVVLANVPSFRVLVPGNIWIYPPFRFVVHGNIRMYPCSGLWSREHPRKRPFWKPPFCEPPEGWGHVGFLLKIEGRRVGGIREGGSAERTGKETRFSVTQQYSLRNNSHSLQ